MTDVHGNVLMPEQEQEVWAKSLLWDKILYLVRDKKRVIGLDDVSGLGLNVRMANIALPGKKQAQGSISKAPPEYGQDRTLALTLIRELQQLEDSIELLERQQQTRKDLEQVNSLKQTVRYEGRDPDLFTKLGCFALQVLSHWEFEYVLEWSHKTCSTAEFLNNPMVPVYRKSASTPIRLGPFHWVPATDLRIVL